MNFIDFNLKPRLLQAIQKVGYTEPTHIQQKCFEPIFSGRDIIGKSQTGTGKTVAFLLPLLQRLEPNNDTEVLVVCPTRELANQTVEQLRNILKDSEGVKSLAIFGGQSIERQIFALKKGCQFVVGTPGRIMDHLRRKTLKLGNLKTIVLDEADEMLNMGFKEDIDTILKSCPKEIQTLLFSATMPPEILKITKEYQKNPEMIEIAKDETTVSKIKQYYIYNKELSKEKVILELVKEFKPKLGLIFVNTIVGSNKLKNCFEKNNIMAYVLNGDMRQSERTKTMQAYKSGKEALLIATDVAARGIDVNDIDYVFNFDLPQKMEYYVHRIGRTARAGKNGVSITIVNNTAQMQSIMMLEKKLNVKIDKLNSVSVEQSIYENKVSKSKTEYGIKKEKLPKVRSRDTQNKWGKDKRQTKFKSKNFNVSKSRKK
ncbi:MAG: DEAD/DEAH box helicase [Christensenellaceae bacterium]|nr:DEAD/DEAH box helicase [Christensenellaceae bacterium]